MTTPPFAMVHYSNGVSITVEQNRLQVSDSAVEKGPEKSKVSEIASAYVRTLPHVQYTAAGHNFQSLIQVKSPDDYLKERFLKSGPWNDAGRPLDAVGVRLVYPLDSGRLALSIDRGEATLTDTSEKDKQLVIITYANFSRNCGPHPAHEQISEFLNKANEDWSVYKQLLYSRA